MMTKRDASSTSAHLFLGKQSMENLGGMQRNADPIYSGVQTRKSYAAFDSFLYIMCIGHEASKSSMRTSTSIMLGHIIDDRKDSSHRTWSAC